MRLSEVFKNMQKYGVKFYLGPAGMCIACDACGTAWKFDQEDDAFWMCHKGCNDPNKKTRSKK